MTKVVINRCFGGPGLSVAALALILELKGTPYEILPGSSTFGLPREQFYHKGHLGDPGYLIQDRDLLEDRSDPALVAAVEQLGPRASAALSQLAVVEIPDHVLWTIADYDGMEHVAERHRTWS